MKKLLSIVAAILFAATTFAKESELNEVTLVTNGSGSTKQEAVNYALRSALEQTFGTFVSANTSIVNDKLTKDEIVSISTGNIKNYKELSSAVLPSGQFAVVVQSTISLSKLTTYAHNHGSKCELAGATFAQNMKLRKLNKENEKKVMQTLAKQLELMENSLYDISISVGTPKGTSESQIVSIPIEIIINANKNAEAYLDLYLSTLNSVKLSDTEIEDYNRTGEKYYPSYLYVDEERLKYYGSTNPFLGYFRNDSICKIGRGLNTQLKNIEICVHGKSNWYYKIGSPIPERFQGQYLYRANPKDYRLFSIEDRINDDSFPCNPRERYSNGVIQENYKVRCDLLKFKPLRQGKKYIYQEITRLKSTLLVYSSEMESITNIELIVP